jgi:outer membrane protein insertion porin family
MNRTHRTLPAACLLLALVLAATAFGQDDALVVRVRVEGNDQVSTKTILSYLRLRRGYRYDAEVLNADVRRLWNLDVVEHVSADVRRVPGGVEVTFKITEKARIEGVRIRGNHKIWRATIREKISHPSSGYLKPYIVKQDVESIRALYHERGFLFATVDYTTEIDDDERYLVFLIQEGPRCAVRRIRFKGNKKFSDRRLNKIIQSSRRRFPALIFRGRFDREKFDQDVARIEDFYRNEGYLDVVVGGNVRYADELERLTLTFRIYEGRKYVTESVAFQGNTLFADDELARVIPLKPGKHFSPNRLLQSRFAIGERYSEIGYFDADIRVNSSGVIAEPVYDAQNARVRVTFRVNEGPRVFIREIHITGNTKTRQNVVRRELTFFPGEAVNMKRVRESQQRLENTGYFEALEGRGVEIDFEPEGAAVRDAIVKVREGRTGSFSFGVGFSTTQSVIGDIAFSDRNFDIFDLPKDWEDLASGNAFRGAGHVLTLRIQPGLQYQSYILSLDNPSVWDTPYSAGVTARWSTVGFTRNYSDTRAGFQLRGGYRYGPFGRVSASVGYDFVTIGDVPDDAPAVYLEDEGNYHRPFVGLGWEFNKVDSTYLPSKGYTLESSLTATFIDVQTLAWDLDGTHYWTVFEPEWWGKHIFLLRGRAGIVTPYQGSHVPIFERLFAGGTRNFRGFDYQGVSPVDPATLEPVGGRSRFIGTAQYSIPVAKDYVRLAGFVDVGWVGATEGELFTGYDELRVAPGAGIRIRLPMLGRTIIGLDFGFPVVKEENDIEQVFHFWLTGLATF